jgi:hypothetical protein
MGGRKGVEGGEKVRVPFFPEQSRASADQRLGQFPGAPVGGMTVSDGSADHLKSADDTPRWVGKIGALSEPLFADCFWEGLSLAAIRQPGFQRQRRVELHGGHRDWHPSNNKSKRASVRERESG